MERVGVDEAGLTRAAAVLAAGGLVIYPTESYYGLGADGLNPAAVERLCRVKQRSSEKSLPVVIGSDATLARLVTHVPEAARLLMDRHWPGPLTLVLTARSGLPEALVGPRGIGLRRSPHPVADALARALDGPLVATSANLSGGLPCQDPDAASAAIPTADLLVDGGQTPGSEPSTVLSVAPDGQMEVLRHGPISIEIKDVFD